MEARPRPPRKRRLDPYADAIRTWIRDRPDLTLAEISARLADEQGVRAPTSTNDDWLRANKISYKKTAHAAEQDRSDVRAARAVWRRRQAWLKRHPDKVAKIVFIDETGATTKMVRLRGRCPRGQRLKAPTPHSHWKTLTFVAGLKYDELIAPWVIDGPMTGDGFVTYVETQLAPFLNRSDVVVMDNLSAHKRPEAEEAISKRGAWLSFLPPYSPDFNPIEQAFSKFKSHLRRIALRTVAPRSRRQAKSAISSPQPNAKTSSQTRIMGQRKLETR